MQVQFRERSVLIQFASIWGSFSTMIDLSFSDNEKTRLLLAAIEEILWQDYRAAPFNGSINSPYVEGKFVHMLTGYAMRQKRYTATHVGAINAQRINVFKAIRTTLQRAGYLPNEQSGWEPGMSPDAFEHGYTLHIVMPTTRRGVVRGKWLQIKWVRPTVDWQEMSVMSYLDRLSGNSENFRAGLSMPLRTLLSGSTLSN